MSVFRGWAFSKPKQDPELQRLEKEMEETRAKVHQLRAQGRQRRAHRLQALDALETRRITLTEILRRMDQELMVDKDVYDYTAVLAEVFGERKIFAHRAIGLEGLLCQFMHQMLAKQHQLKSMKKSAKEIQKHYQKHIMHNKDEFHSFDALAVQMEASRLSLEAMYDDIFAAQHAMLAQLNNVKAGGNVVTNYKVVKKPALSVSTKHPVSAEDLKTPTNPPHDGLLGEKSPDDNKAVLDILSSRDEDDNLIVDEKKGASEQQQQQQTPKPSQDNNKDPSRRESDTNQKSARVRRREIEHLRKAGVVGRRSTSNISMDDEGNARERMRALETKRASQSRSPSVDAQEHELQDLSSKSGPSSFKSGNSSSSSRQWSSKPSSSSSSQPLKKDDGDSVRSKDSSAGSDETADYEQRRERRERRMDERLRGRVPPVLGREQSPRGRLLASNN
jgi:hypothetical protein